MAETIIKTENLSYVYSAGTPYEHRAIDNINIEIEKGSFVGLIGHTGSGKSTLIQHLNGLIKPTSGKIFVGGEDLWANPKDIRRFRFKVGLVFQYPEHQLFEDTVYKDIAFGPRKVIFIVGMNKVTKDVDAAMKRARNEAAPINAQRFGLDTPCAKTGSCMNCKSPDTICCQFLITRYSRHKDRIHVFLVNDNLGF